MELLVHVVQAGGVIASLRGVRYVGIVEMKCATPSHADWY